MAHKGHKGWQAQLATTWKIRSILVMDAPEVAKVQGPHCDALATATRTRNSRRCCDNPTQHPQSELGLAKGDQPRTLRLTNPGSGQGKPVLHGRGRRPNQALEIQFAGAATGATNAARAAEWQQKQV